MSMTYSPSESEKRNVAIVQSLAAVFFFVPAAIALQTAEGKRSPYLKYWYKVSVCWSLMMVIVIVTAFALGRILEVPTGPVILGIIHGVFCMTGALSAYFNTPFCYWFVAHTCCRDELGEVYGQLLSAPSGTDTK